MGEQAVALAKSVNYGSAGTSILWKCSLKYFSKTMHEKKYAVNYLVTCAFPFNAWVHGRIVIMFTHKS